MDSTAVRRRRGVTEIAQLRPRAAEEARINVILSVADASLVATTLLACGSGVSTGTNTGAGAVATPLLQTCAGSYVCTADGSSDATDTTLTRDGETCAAGTLLFETDNTVTDADQECRWE